MNILLLGGTGVMGEYLTQILSEYGNNVTVTSRSAKESKNKVQYLQGNAKDLDFIKSILNSKWDAIVDFMVYSTVEFQKRVELLLNATNQYVYLSSARVYAESEKPIVENSPRLLDVSNDKEFLSTDDYSLTKARQENILINSKKNNWTIIRPYITFSPQRLQLGVLEKEDWLYRAIKGRTIVFSGDINSKLTTLTLGFDVAKSIAVLIGKEDVMGEIFHITNNKQTPWCEILDVYLDVLEKHLGYRPIVQLENQESYLSDNPVAYQIIYDRFFNRLFDNSKIAKYIDVSSFVETTQGLRNSLEEFLKNPRFKRINWSEEAKRDRKTKDFTPLNDIIGLKQKIKYLFYRFIKK